MLLEIRDIKQNSFKICVKLSETILQVKEKIKSKVEIIEIDDQTLVYSGNILSNDTTVEECDINKNDYVTLIYRSTQLEEVYKIMENVRDDSKSDVSQESAKSPDATTRDHIPDMNQTMDDSNDSELDDLSHNALLADPGVQNLCKIIINDPVVLPKHLSKLSRQRQGPPLFQKILENQHAYINLLNGDEFSSVNNGCKKVEKSNDHEVIDRLVQKGYGKEIAIQVYQACDLNESGAAELLNYLH